jgi:hypothetical protein
MTRKHLHGFIKQRAEIMLKHRHKLVICIEADKVYHTIIN